MNDCAPNLTALIGEQVGARLIAHAGSLTNLAKSPASTVQILGAEKALFRALKTRGKTPKYGLIFHSSFIGRAGAKNKGRISRYLANKCSLASRIDSFSDTATDKFGHNFKSQVEERLEFYKSGKTPRKNQEVMAKAITEVNSEEKEEKKETPSASSAPVDGEKKKKKKKKQKEIPLPIATTPATTAPTPNGEPAKKKKKRKREAEATPAPTTPVTETTGAPEKAKKKKKKDKKPKV